MGDPTTAPRELAQRWAAGCDCHGTGVAFIGDPPRNPGELHALIDAGWLGCPYTMTLRRPCVRCHEAERERLFAWVRERHESRRQSSGKLACREDLAMWLSEDLGLSWDPLGIESEQPAWALCEAAGWPS